MIRGNKSLGLLVGLIAITATVPAGRAQLPGTGVMVHGPEAVRVLKQEKVYDSLATAYQGALYRVEARETVGTAAWHAGNPVQKIRADFSGDRVEIQVDKTAGTSGGVSLRLTEYGYEGAVQSPAAAEPAVTENRVEYRRGALTEWYVNDRRGLEQGFTLARPPAGKTGGPLLFTMAIDTELQVRADDEAGPIQFTDFSGEVRLRYAELKAWDAVGRELPATMQAQDGEITLVVADTEAVYPVTIDPLLFTETKLTAGDAAAGDEFGDAVAISGDTVVVGAHFKSGVTGAAYVFVRSNGVWSQQQRLTAGDAAALDEFGYSVAISGDTAVVGALRKASFTGAAYVFVRSNGVWSQQQKLTASDAAAGAAFGNSVGISGDTAVVGANGNAGAAYVFVRSSGVWSQQPKLTASDGAAGDQFGASVGISGDTTVVGATGKAAYIFVRTGIAWNEEAKLTASDQAMDSFGFSVGISGDTAIVGAPTKSNSTGAAYVYVNTTSADLLVGLGADKTSVRQGDTLTYTITAKNFGPNRTLGVAINDTLSSGVTFVNAQANKGNFTAPPTGQTGVVTWYLPEILPSGEESAYLKVSVVVRGRTTITNTATIKSNTPDPNLVNNTASLTTSVAPGNSSKNN